MGMCPASISALQHSWWRLSPPARFLVFSHNRVAEDRARTRAGVVILPQDEPAVTRPVRAPTNLRAIPPATPAVFLTAGPTRSTCRHCFLLPAEFCWQTVLHLPLVWRSSAAALGSSRRWRKPAPRATSSLTGTTPTPHFQMYGSVAASTFLAAAVEAAVIEAAHPETLSVAISAPLLADTGRA